jgi:hypothetical protein
MIYTVQVFMSNAGTVAKYRITTLIHVEAENPGEAYSKAKEAMSGMGACFGFCVPGKLDMLPGMVATGGVQQ